MIFDIITIFPGFFSALPGFGVTGRALASGLVEVRAHDLRDYTDDRHRTTDDSPYGGGCGMVMKVEPVARAIEAVRGGGAGKRSPECGVSVDAAANGCRVLLTTPQGVPFTQAMARELSGLQRLVIVCGRYEGVDERIRGLVDMEVSIGDYVLTGGEIPALVIMDAVSRLLPGVLGSEGSKEDDSFSRGLLEYPQYTRPPEFRGRRVPDVLLSGDHARIERYRKTESIRRTLEKRPELLEEAELTETELEILREIRAGKELEKK